MSSKIRWGERQAVTLRSLFDTSGDRETPQCSQTSTKLQARLEARISFYKKRHKELVEQIEDLTKQVKIQDQKLEAADRERVGYLQYTHRGGPSFWIRQAHRIDCGIKVHEDEIARLCEDRSQLEQKYSLVKDEAARILDKMNLADQNLGDDDNDVNTSTIKHQLRTQFLHHEDTASTLKDKIAKLEHKIKLIHHAMQDLEDDKRGISKHSRDEVVASKQLQVLATVKEEKEYLELENHELRQENDFIVDMRTRLYDLQDENQRLKEQAKADALRIESMEDDIRRFSCVGNEILANLTEILGGTQDRVGKVLRLKTSVWQATLSRFGATYGLGSRTFSTVREAEMDLEAANTA